LRKGERDENFGGSRSFTTYAVGHSVCEVVGLAKKSEINLIHAIELKNAPSLISSDGLFGWDSVIS
jgi:hypothetical protein